MSRHQSARIQIDVRVAMRDGVTLSTDIYRPPGSGPFPTLLVRTIYDNQDPSYMEWTRRFLEAGYAVVMQDCRGRFDSDGAWEPYIHEAEDGYDTQQWLGSQPWCDGNIGTFGVSYPGFTQTQSAPLNSRYVKALVPIATRQDMYGHTYEGGALSLHTSLFQAMIAGRTVHRSGFALADWNELYRRLPLVAALDDIVDVPFYRQTIEHYTYDEFWKRHALRDKYDQVDTPAYFITGWYDALLDEVFAQYQAWKVKAGSEETRRHTRIMVGPWTHYAFSSSDLYGAIDYRSAGDLDFVAEHIRWYDQRLRDIDTGIDEEPPLCIFVMGDNVWRSEDSWPLARTDYTKYYLDGARRANSLHGDGRLSTEPPTRPGQDRYVYDPENPVPTLGGPIMHREYAGPHDRRPVERRDDVLVYTSEPLERDLEVTGPVTLALYASSSAPDTDFAAALVDVYPDGRAIHICEGIRRARFRESFEEPTLIEPGGVYEYEINMWETSNVFKEGHRIRVEVTSSNFPRFDRNPNTGNRPGMDAELRVAEQTVHHGGEYPSHITLPVIPR